MHEETEYLKGRGAQLNTKNPFLANEYGQFAEEGIDEEAISNSGTTYYRENPKKIINKIDSPDLGLEYSMNPYQGCEHGCIYCYARNSHQYWGFSAGLDFERKIIIKENAPEMLEKQLKHPKWKVSPIMFSGNTDCYQPIERKLKITRRMLEILLKYRHPVGIITKNDLILRDLDLLEELNQLNLVHVSISITTLDESLRRQLEPRTTTAEKRLNVVRQLSAKDIPVNVMIAPVIPAINSTEIPEIIKRIADNGAVSAAYTIVRLNGSIGAIFEDWVKKNFPDRAEKVLHQIADCHGGQLNDSRFGTRMRGEGNIAESIRRIFLVSKKKYLGGRKMKTLDTQAFYDRRDPQLRLF